MISSAGAGGGSFNHRFAMPGQAGNSVLSVLRPVDLPPFTDEGLLARRTAPRVTPKIFYTFSSTEYWARAGSLTHTSDDGRSDVPLAPTSRLYFLAGTPHSSGALPLAGPSRVPALHQLRRAAMGHTCAAPRSRCVDARRQRAAAVAYPSIAKGELVPLEDVHFPMPSFPFATYMPQVWRMDYGRGAHRDRVITIEPPHSGEPYRVLVPQVQQRWQRRRGIRLPEVAVPLGTYTGWNVRSRN